MERQPNTIYVASLSYGKDSIAMLHVIKDILHYPLDRIIHAEVWFNDTIPADLPPMVEFKAKADAIIKERWGIEVEHVCAMKKSQNVNVERERERGSRTEITSSENEQKETAQGRQSDSLCNPKDGVRNSNTSKLTYQDIFYRTLKPRKPKVLRGGVLSEARTTYGFPTRRANWCNGKLKAGVLDKNIRIPDHPRRMVQKLPQDECTDGRQDGVNTARGNSSRSTFSDKPANDGQKINIVQYLGIAADEPKRIARHIVKPNVILPLVDADWDEGLCGLWCQYSDLLSPTYTTSMRGGCWFCHNQGVDQLRILRHDYPDLWAELMKLDSDSPVSFHADGHTVHDFDARFAAEDRGEICAGNRFRWDDVLAEDRQLKMNF